MKDLVIILGSSSIATPHHPDHHSRRHHHSAKNKPSSSLHKLSPSEKPPAIPSVHPHSKSHSLLSSVRWDLTSRCKSDLKYYADLASKLAEDGRLEDFVVVVETVIDSGVNASHLGAMLNVELVSKGVSRNLLERKAESVVEALKKIERVGIAPVKLVDKGALELPKRECRRLVDCGQVEEAVDLMEVLAGFNFTVKELVAPSHIVKICVDKRNPKLAIRYACLLPHAHILFCSIIKEFGKMGDMVSAWIAYEASKKQLSGPNMYIYRTIIDVCGLCDDYMKSRDLYKDLLNQNVTPNIYVFNSLMNVNAHDLRFTLDVFKNMQNLGITADMASYNILLKACCLAGRVDLAQEVFNEVKHLESAGVVRLDIFTYSTIIKAFADAKMWQMALHIKEDMLSAGVIPNTVTWSALISACANAGLVEQATKLFEEMLLAGCDPNSQCCNILLHAHVEACQYDRAFRLFNCWTGRTLQKNSDWDFNGKTDSFSSTGELNRTYISSELNCIPLSNHLSSAKRFSFRPTTTTYNILMKACGTDYYRGKALMDEMKSLGLSPNYISWSILIDTCGGSGNIQGAIQILKTMHLDGVKPDVVAYTTAIKVCVGSKNLNLAFSLYEEMKRYHIQPNLVTYNTLLRARSRYGSLIEVQQCLAIYQDMRKAGYKSNDYYLKELIEEWCEGVIKENYRNQEESSSQKRTDLKRTYGLLLEKVALHLQKSTADSIAIDLQGLTKVEARIVVLAVLRMIKENYILGNLVKDDVLIIIGVGVLDADPKSEVKDSIIKLLKNELGLEVILVKTKVTEDERVDTENLSSSNPNIEVTVRNNKVPMKSLSSTRRPVILQRLKITKRSLHHWLQRRIGAIKR
ncbi:hypothetical protein SLEP1_g38977 [Rubroshorea leprosula]|uniref:Pentatricopeptide repeat-containing protein n=1 Tax=Rubroshorea leprosula TaxID=152421 RepID=A0AAV5KYR1_9ROSI|nr:hypothetical protein SLEP1_g38977 [Rubroshorea leprosula]